MIVLRQKEYTRAEKEAMFQLMRLTKGFKSLPESLNTVENATRFKKFSNRLAEFARKPYRKISAKDLKEMKGFLNDIGADKFADNFEPIINKYYGNNNIEAWKRLRLREEKLPAKAIENRKNRLTNRSADIKNSLAEADSVANNFKSTKGKSSKEIFSSPEGKLMKNIIKGETGGINQPSIHFNKVKGRNKLSDKLTNVAIKSGSAGDYPEKLVKKQIKKDLRGGKDFFAGDGHGYVFLSHANPSILSHELGHGKSFANSIAAGTPFKVAVGSPKKLRSHLEKSVSKRARAIYGRLDNLSTIAEENMANVYGRDIIRKYGGKNVNKHLADYEKLVDNINMKSYLSGARLNDVRENASILNNIRRRRGMVQPTNRRRKAVTDLEN